MENQNRIIIPESFMIIVDDVGWWLPHNKRLYSATWNVGEIDRERPYCLDDYLFPELKGLTANAVTAPATALNPEER